MSRGQEFTVIDERLTNERAALERALQAGRTTSVGLAALTKPARQVVESWAPTDSQLFALLRMQLPLIPTMTRGWMGVGFAHRCLYVLRVGELLRSAYPNAGDCMRRWLHTENWSPTLAGRSPMDCLVDDDLRGCVVVHDHLELLANPSRLREMRQ